MPRDRFSSPKSPFYATAATLSNFTKLTYPILRFPLRQFFQRDANGLTMKMSDAHGAVVHLMWPRHLVWGPPRRAVHSPTIADGTASPTGANFRSQACISCISSPQASEFTPLDTPPPRRRRFVAVAAAALHIRPPQLPRVVTRAIGIPAGARWRPRARRSRERSPVRHSHVS